VLDGRALLAGRWKYLTTRMASWMAMPEMERRPLAAETGNMIG
jgi:hypothetical protein